MEVLDDHHYVYRDCTMTVNIADPKNERYTLIYDQQRVDAIYQYGDDRIDIELDRSTTVCLIKTNQSIDDDDVWRVTMAQEDEPLS